MPRKFRSLAMSMLLAVFCVSCAKGPSDVAQSVFEECNAGNYSEAEQYLTTDLQKALHGQQATLRGGMKYLCDTITRNGTLTKVVVKSTATRGEGSTVTLDLFFKDGTVTRGDAEPMAKENGKWKLSPSMGQ